MPPESERPDAKLKTWAGLIVVVVGIAAFFSHGYLFDLWGQRLQFRWASLGWFGWLSVVAFGAGAMTGGIKDGLKTAAGVIGLLSLALIVGFLSGKYS
ncbi:hypothetical protein [Asticcacaulis sp.]|uniref:hypothetical protein n=1 Tax=Asticcacaulis sp. TaxID=1872648 RepID=UPI0026173468|nr:hypothetical protein [Asticcacaulis sp.]